MAIPDSLTACAKFCTPAENIIIRRLFPTRRVTALPVDGDPSLPASFCRPNRGRFGSPRAAEGVETCMVGRDAELEQLQGAFKRLYRQDQLIAVTVVAEAGIGKSRLLYEFENWAGAQADRYCLFQGRAHPQAQNQPYGLLRDILAWRLQIADSDSMEAAKQKIEAGIAPLFRADDGDDMALAHAHLLGHLIGLDFSESRHISGIKDDGEVASLVCTRKSVR